MSSAPGHIWAACAVGWMLIGANGGPPMSYSIAAACFFVAIMSWARASNTDEDKK